MKMFVANCTQQVQNFIYRVPEQAGTRMQLIEIGGQVVLSGELTTPGIEAIVKQHSRSGMVEMSEVGRTSDRVTLCFSLDKPVPADRIRQAITYNNDRLTIEGRERRRASAVAVNNLVEQNADGLKRLDVSVVEETTKKNPDPQLSEGFRVSREGPHDEPARPTPPTRRQRRGAVA